MRFLFILFCVFNIIGLTAQVTFSGIIVDGKTKETVKGSTIQLKVSGDSTTSDPDGRFTINAALNDEVCITHSIYLTKCLLVTNDQNITIELEQNPDLININNTLCGPGAIESQMSNAIVVVNENNFNQGSIADPILLLQGRVPGLSISNRGGNPNAQAFMRIRGINSYGSMSPSTFINTFRGPLIVVDDVVQASLYNIDPNDIESFEIIKDGASAARYGMRGSDGVVVIKTKKASKAKGLISYQGQLGLSNHLEAIQNYSREEFLAKGGYDLGSNTSWLSEITQAGSHHNHSLVLQKEFDHLGLRLSGNFRNVDGILKTTGFSQYNVRGNVNTSLAKNKLKLNLDGSWTKKSGSLGFEEAFKEAVFRNPTAPVFGDNLPFPYDAAQYGGYYENKGLAYDYNPVAMLELNKNYEKKEYLNVSGKLSYAVTNDLTLRAHYAHQTQSNDDRGLFSIFSNYKGNATSPNRKGLVELTDVDDQFDLLNLDFQYSKSFGLNTLFITGGIASQRFNSQTYTISMSNFEQEIDFEFFRNNIDLSKGKTSNTRLSVSPDEKLSSQFLFVNYHTYQGLMLNGSLRRDGSSRLGKENQYGLFPALSLGWDIAKAKHWTTLNQLIFRVGYGITGGLPHGYGLSKQIKSTYIDNMGNVQTYISQYANDQLKWESQNEINFGFNIGNERWRASLDVYSRKSYDLILGSFVPEFAIKYENKGVIQTRGVEMMIDYNFINKTHLKYNMGLVIASSKSINVDLDGREYFMSGLGTPGLGIQTHILKEELEIGSIVGPVFDGVGQAGNPKYKDINNDGVIVIDRFFNGATDLAILGNGNPDIELGWRHNCTIKTWEINAFIRGAFGHSLVNANRIYGEFDYTGVDIQNSVNTSKKAEGLTVPRYSSLYVEKADFIKLDNLSISRSLSIKNSLFKQLKISLIGQNLITLTGYTGGDPEPALLNKGPQEAFTANTYDQLSAGADYRSTYLPSRTFLLNIQLAF